MDGVRVNCEDRGKREGEIMRSRRERRKTRTPPLNSLVIARNASTPSGICTMDAMELGRAVYEGVLLEDNTKRFWVDEKVHKNCFMVLAKGLSITWIGDKRYWDWVTYQEKCFRGPVDVPAARLLQVWWLEGSGKLQTIMLSPMTTYEVVCVVKMCQDAEGWHLPFNLCLILPNGTTQGRGEILKGKPKEQWMEIPFGEFVTTPENVGEIEVTLGELSGHAKAGFIIKGVIFRPKIDDP